MAVLTCLYLIYLVAPIALLLLGSFGGVWANSMLPSGATLHWYGALLDDPSLSRAFRTSLTVVSATCVIDVVIGLPAAYALHSQASKSVRFAGRLISLLPVAVPELTLAFGFILLFSTDTLPWLGTSSLLIAGHVVLTLPYLLNTLLADMEHLRLAELEMVAGSLGAGFGNRFFDIVVPTLRHSVLSGLITVAALSIGEFQLSNLVSGFLNRTYPTFLLQAFYGATGFACAATVVLLSLALAAAVVGALVARAGGSART
ncbi:ABC transporter permease [Telmatospirillum siberiense]|uniref:ABC transporter permease n=1 Tax=Telmatospirillum siberiense TaxID=382514 RepID=A0A2N3PW40_9PROT|nr:ABC transporter permease subunit [Telmatospirillum siberiense]PKU24633.1 ABC transporter permease [Telmatospirillum siberiense]